MDQLLNVILLLMQKYNTKLLRAAAVIDKYTVVTSSEISNYKYNYHNLALLLIVKLYDVVPICVDLFVTLESVKKPAHECSKLLKRRSKETGR